MVRPKLSAKAKALQLLSAREHSRAELLIKLHRRGYSEEEAAQAVDWAAEQRFQSDERFAGSLFRRRASVYGDRAIRHELKEHGVAAIPVPEDSDSSIESEEQRILRFLNRKALPSYLIILTEDPSNSKDSLFHLKAKMYRALQSRGFDTRNIDKGWKQFLADRIEDA